MNFFSYLNMAARTLLAKGRRNVLKMLTLSLGLAVGLVLASKVCFEQTYDDFHSNANRIVYLSEIAEQDGNLNIYAQTSGGIAPLMKAHYPEVEQATRSTFFETGASLIDVETKARYHAPNIQLADSCYFKVFDRECLAGNITSSLGIKNNVAISSKLAKAMAGSRNAHTAATEMVGRKFTIGSRGDSIVFTIAGVYENFPANSSFRPDVIIALPSIGQFTYDGSANLVGNDRYKSFLKLRKGTSPESLNAKMDGFVQAYLPVGEMKQSNVWISYKAKKLQELHFESDDIRNTVLMLGIVAFALLLVSILNYMLIVISTCVTRSKEMALRKCIGSDRKETAKMMFAEALLHTLIATAIAAAILFAARGFVENFLGIGLADLFVGKPMALAVGIVLGIILLNGSVPARIFEGIPVATAFRGYSESRRVWKMWLLIIEFALVAFLCVLIGVISVQYHRMTNADLGFSYTDNIEIATPEANSSQHKILMDELRAMPEVADACFAFREVFPGFSDNNVRLPGHKDELFNAHDLYYVDDHWLNVMGIELMEGRNFNPDLLANSEVIVDTRFAEKLKATTGWDSVIGHHVSISEHADNITIIGIIAPIELGHFSKQDEDMANRPKMVFYCNPDKPMTPYHYPFQYVRFHKLTSETYFRAHELVQRMLPGQATYTIPFVTAMEAEFKDTLETRSSILVGNIITLLTAILGLIGYTIDEIKRRAKEIAVRRVNGALFGQIRGLFRADTLRIAVPSAIIGCLAGSFVALRWEQNFTMQVGLPWWILLAAAAFTIGTVVLVTEILVTKTANTNPAESIKTE